MGLFLPSLYENVHKYPLCVAPHSFYLSFIKLENYIVFYIYIVFLVKQLIDLPLRAVYTLLEKSTPKNIIKKNT